MEHGMLRLLLLVSCLSASAAQGAESVCFGTTANGYLENGVELPAEGSNYVTYSNIARLAGRSYVHSAVRDIVVAAYRMLETEQPSKVYKYAETGFASGGRFRPHKTHMNGLSVDFMTPVRDSEGRSVHLPTNLFNKFGYNIEFDQLGVYDGMVIDYEALAAHIVALDKAANALGYGLWRVIFAPELQPHLFQTAYGAYLSSHIEFSKKRSWVRHDEHYHVDFDIPCTAV
ncbi:replication initiation protein [Corallincola holothuriorum]|uniref:Replication initiation protein n=2 Tax=Corallincola holothuriorum TaxID=2282215 RepID=A0A368NMD1_9GAMM|nr:replication initiation protein [Corallincola holothuriorum]